MNNAKSVFRGREAYLEAVHAIGWFEYSSLTYEEVAERIKTIEAPDSFVLALSEASFDTGGFESAGAYQSVMSALLRLTEILKNAPLQCTLDSENFSISITLQGERRDYYYLLDTRKHGNGFDPKVIEVFLNEQVLPGEGCDLRFFVLPPCGQTANLVFAPPAMYEEAVERGLIPEGTGYFMEKRP